jgi:AcrR family transcriptional regulator
MESYHHGNLREALIKAGIEHIGEKGSDSLSLRMISQSCGVSHAAVYTHFKNKSALMNAMRDFINSQFIEELKKDVEKNDNPKDKFTKLGRNYVGFFVENPYYFSFLYKHTDIIIDLDNLEKKGNYLPFEFFKSVATEIILELNIPKEAHLQHIVAMWGIMIGIVSVLMMKSTQYTGDWDELTNRILTENILLKRRTFN